MTVLEILSVSVLLTMILFVKNHPTYLIFWFVREKNPEEKKAKRGFYDKKQRKSVLFAY